MTDPVRLPDARPYLPALPPGTLVIERSYGMPGRERRVRALVAEAHGHGLRVLVAGDPALARACGADGVHLPEGMARSLPRHALRGLRLVTMAAHGPRAMAAARRIGADAVLLSPVFPTQSHLGAPALGPLRLGALARVYPCPVLALGGVTPRNWRRLAHMPGVIGWAGIGFAARPASVRPHPASE
ncbi:thiamine phosphate synthase [Futiania mangrovi]|uniref:Thiamine phosphate synthase n=1 Tax=Futiania mangrovi TaxID=2959716 RepID=A0A9J6PBE4_9PROT|nr:thiamine phosphate synthase [Futiania mangrovii]MCP1336517.1 thiamine phosphate synthase [Futiania mangrovii]